MNHVGPYVTNELGQKADLNFINPKETLAEDYSTDDLFRSAIIFFEGNKSKALDSVNGTLKGQYPFENPMQPGDDEVMTMFGVALESDELKGQVESDFKNLYGVDLTPENLEFAYRNTTTIGKGFNGEKDDVARPLFKYSGEFNDDNMHLLAFTLCRAVQCKGMNQPLQSGFNSEFCEDVQTSFDPKQSEVYFKAPDKDPVSFDPDGKNRPAEPTPIVENTVPKPKWYQKAAATLLPFTKWGKNSQKAIDDYNVAEKKHQDSVVQNRKEFKELEDWKGSFSAAAEQKYEESKSKFEAYYNKRHEMSGDNDFTKQKQGVKEIGIGDVKVEGPDMNGIDKPDYTKLRNSINNKDKDLNKTTQTSYVPGNK